MEMLMVMWQRLMTGPPITAQSGMMEVDMGWVRTQRRLPPSPCMGGLGEVSEEGFPKEEVPGKV